MNDGEKKSRRSPYQPKKRKLPTPERLAAAALRYLEKFAASEASLRRVLQNRLRRACLDDEAFAADTARQAALAEAIEKIVAQHKRSGVINDASFAEMKVRSLRRSGASARRIVQKLGQKGVASPLISQAVDAHQEEEGEDTERAAARVFARKRALGPYRRADRWPDEPAARQVLNRKDSAALARAGFSYDVIAAILGEDPRFAENV